MTSIRNDRDRSRPSDNQEQSAVLAERELSTLGAPTRAIERVVEMILATKTKEFSWVPEDAYRSGRLRVLRTFLERERIFGTKAIRERIEARARENLQRKIAELGA